jgi:hypothetical protein
VRHRGKGKFNYVSVFSFRDAILLGRIWASCLVLDLGKLRMNGFILGTSIGTENFNGGV